MITEVLDRRTAERAYALAQELKRRSKLPINTYVPDSTEDRNQLKFHQSTCMWTLAYGGNRSGKSVSAAYEVAAAARNCNRFKDPTIGPQEIYVISSEYRTIYQGIYRHLKPELTGMKFLDKRWIMQEGPKIPGASVPLPSYLKIYTEFDNEGNRVDPEAAHRPFSTIWFVSGEGGEQARRKLQAAALDLVAIDEEVGEDLYQELLMRLLDRNGKIIISCTLIRSEDWLLDLEDRAEAGDEEVCLVRLNTGTNEHLSAKARENIIKSMSEEEKAIRIDGKSRRAFGLVYPNFNADHIFKTLPEGALEEYDLFFATDPGFRVHAGLWAAFDRKSFSLYIYRELYQKGATLEDTCKLIHELEGASLTYEGAQIYRRVELDGTEKVTTRLIDPSSLRHLEDGQPGVALQMTGNYDLAVLPAPNEIRGGIECVRKLLETNPATGKPHLMVHEDCLNFFSERRRYKFQKNTKSGSHANKGVPLKRDDHLMDCLKYLASHIFITMGFAVAEENDVGRIRLDLPFSYSKSLEERMSAHDKYGKTTVHSVLGSEF